MNRPLRVGLVGADAGGRGWGPVAHMPALAALDEFELVALCTSRPETAAAAAAAYGVDRAFHDVGQMAAEPDIDIISVAVRVPHHHDLAMAALDAGKHVYCEWPLGATVAEAEAMADRAEANGVVAAVGLQGRHVPALMHLRQLVDSGWIGDLVSVTVTMLGSGALDHRSSDAWMGDDSNGANTMTIVAGHTLDVLEACFGPLIELAGTVAVQHPTWQLADTGATIDVDAPDTVLLNGVLTNGAVVSFHAGSVPHHGSGWRMEAHGTGGTLVAATPVMPQISPVTLTGAQGPVPLAELDVVDESGGVALPVGPARNVARAYAQLARAIRTGTPFDPDFAHAVGVHRLLDDVRASSDTGSRIRRTAPA